METWLAEAGCVFEEEENDYEEKGICSNSCCCSNLRQPVACIRS